MPDTSDLAPMSELGSSGLRNSGGFVREEFLTELQGRNKFRIYNEMRNNDPVIGAMLTAIETMMRQSECKVERGEEATQRSEDAKEFLRSVKKDVYPDWESTLSDILSFVWAGHSVHEMVYKRREGHKPNPIQSSRYDDGRIGLARLPIRQQETLWEWEFDGKTGLVEGVYQREAMGGHDVFIPSEKFINFKPKHSRQNPEGSSALRSSYRPWHFKKRIQEIESIGIERDLAGMPKATVPFEMLKEDASDDYKDTLDNIKEIVRNIRRDEQEGIVWPRMIDPDTGEDLFGLELMSAGGERQFNINDIVKRYDQRIAMTVLADFILIGHESVGSFALANQKTSSFALALEAWLGAIENKLNNKFVPQLFRLNDFNLDEGEMPRFKFSEVETANLDALGNYMASLHGAGFKFSEDQGLRDWLLEQAGAPLEKGEGRNRNSETDDNEGEEQNDGAGT